MHFAETSVFDLGLFKYLALSVIAFFLIFVIAYKFKQVKSSYYSLRGNIQYSIRDYTKAQKSYENALCQTPRDLYLILKIGDLLAEKIGSQQALKHYLDACNLKFSPDIEFRLGNLYSLEGEFDSAIQHFENVHFLSPSKFRPLYQVAKVYIQQGNYSAFDSLARIIINKEPKFNSAEVIMMKEEMKSQIKFKEVQK